MRALGMQLCRRQRHRAAGGFSLVELITVVVILGLIATIAIPRMSRGAEGAAESALAADLALLEGAIERYRVDHVGDAPQLADMPAALLDYTSEQGAVSTTKDATHRLGPYIDRVPEMKLGELKGDTSIGPFSDAGVAWQYDESTGRIRANVKGIGTFELGEVKGGSLLQATPQGGSVTPLGG